MKTIILSLAVLLILGGLWISFVIGYQNGKHQGFKEGQDFIAFTDGEDKEDIIGEIRQKRQQEELSDFARKQRALYK